MTDLRLAIFDIDGTLIDSQDFILAAMKRAFAALDHPEPSRADVLSIVGLSLDRAVSVLMPALSEVENAHAVKLYKQSFLDLRAEQGGEQNIPMYPGARAALERLHVQDTLLMGVATGKAKRGLDHAYDSHDIGKFFVTSQTADGHPSKPHPSMLHTALAETGVDVSRAVMIGDTEFDIEMGRAAGFATIGVSWGYHPVDRIKAAGADLIIDDFAELDDALKKIWS
ncbi:MAG: HAD-IA family hydrolase [Rhodobacteraceae bacterium]|nr:HAD-IA family hydrolase [Paracoccaceae bacterium]